MQFQHLRALPDAQAVLAARARALGRSDAAEAADDGTAVLTFELGGAGYALAAANLAAVAAGPGAPEAW